jgi:hypothetical protein
MLFNATKNSILCKTIILIFCGLQSIFIHSQQAWNFVPTPDTSQTRNILFGIDGVSSSDLWVGGSFETTPGNLKNLLIHWNGLGWQHAVGTDLSSTYNEIRDMAAISSDNIWATGAYVEPGTTRSQLLHWNGSNWTHTILPAIPGGSFLNSIDAIASNDIWAVGGQAGSPIRPAYTLHYNGSNWTEFPAASPGLLRNYFNNVDGISSSDVWAVGYYGDAYGDFHAMAQHWNGTAWTNYPLPSAVVIPQGELGSVTMISSSDVWALGSTLTGGILLIHWNGSSWSEVSTAGSAGGVIISRGTDIFAVGDRISQWNGSSWSVIDPLNQLSYPSLVAATIFSNGDIWTCGRSYDTAFHNLVYRTANATPQFQNGAIQYIEASLGVNNFDQPLKTIDADQSQVVYYSIITPPSHGTLSGLPDTTVTVAGFAVPSGITYVREAGYTGPDQLIIEAAVGPLQSQTTINITPLAALPVLLTNYTVTKAGQKAVMVWTTGVESGVSRFEMERSTDAIHFNPIRNQTALGSGSTYTLVDLLPERGWNYYRLKEIDMDGSETYFSVKSLFFEKPSLMPLHVSPNPVENKLLKLHVNIPGEYSLIITDQQGRNVFSGSLSQVSGTVNIKIPGTIPPGIYNLTYVNKTGTWQERVMIR